MFIQGQGLWCTLRYLPIKTAKDGVGVQRAEGVDLPFSYLHYKAVCKPDCWLSEIWHGGFISTLFWWTELTSHKHLKCGDSQVHFRSPLALGSRRKIIYIIWKPSRALVEHPVLLTEIEAISSWLLLVFLLLTGTQWKKLKHLCVIGH